METPDPTELAEAATDPFKTYCALLVSTLALILALNNLGGSNTGKEATMTNILAANMYSFYQAKSIRQTEYKLVADRLEIQLATEKLSPQATELIQNKLAAYKKTSNAMSLNPKLGKEKKNSWPKPSIWKKSVTWHCAKTLGLTMPKACSNWPLF
jgi:hypothetical protein